VLADTLVVEAYTLDMLEKDIAVEAYSHLALDLENIHTEFVEDTAVVGMDSAVDIELADHIEAFDHPDKHILALPEDLQTKVMVDS
jgi:hypothetical protein